MTSYKPQIINLLKQLVFIFVLYGICRFLFYYFNRSHFHDISSLELSSLMLYGLRFDAFSIAATNSLYILLSTLPFKFYYHSIYQKITSAIFILTNTLALLSNFVDFAYFPYTQKRTTSEVSHLIFGEQTEFTKLIPHFLAEFWYLVILFALFIWLLIKVHLKIKKSEVPQFVDFKVLRSIQYFFIFILIGGLTVLGIRGGLQRVPIVLMDAAHYTSPKFTPIVLNTPFSIIKSSELTELKPLNFYSDKELEKIYNPIHLADTGQFKNYNICILVLESFSKEFTCISNRKSYTPFLDSLMTKSVVYKNAIANGKTSINGIPSIIAAMPSLMENQYLNSIYSNNSIQTLPNLLKEKGYSSVFYHGGTNGTMSFNSFAKLAGYDAYYGRTEYNNDDDFDGQWGIWDEPFLQKTVTEISALKPPFFTSIFTLSSHNPYEVPQKYKGKFPKGKLEIIQTIGYSDYALKQFFKSAQQQSWFNNTLFVITPDHTAVSEDAFYSNLIGQYSIPIIFYKNGITPKMEEKTVQQLDILPTILDYLNYDKNYYSFGKSMLTESKEPSIFYNSPNYCCVLDSFMYIFNGQKFIEKYNFKSDSSLQQNIWKEKEDEKLQNYCKAFLQNYTNDMINNKTDYHTKK